MMYSMMKPLTPMFAEPFFRDFFGEPQRRPHRPAMQMRLHETDTAYLLESDLPGVGRDNINLSVDGNVLTISALRRGPKPPRPTMLTTSRPATSTAWSAASSWRASTPPPSPPIMWMASSK